MRNCSNSFNFTWCLSSLLAIKLTITYIYIYIISQSIEVICLFLHSTLDLPDFSHNSYSPLAQSYTFDHPVHALANFGLTEGFKPFIMSTFTSLLVLVYFLLFYTVLGEKTPNGVMILPVHTVGKNPAVGSFRRRDNVPVAKVFNGSQYVVSSKSSNSTYGK